MHDYLELWSDSSRSMNVSILEEAICGRRLSEAGIPKGARESGPHLETEIVKRSDQAGEFVVLPRR